MKRRSVFALICVLLIGFVIAAWRTIVWKERSEMTARINASLETLRTREPPTGDFWILLNRHGPEMLPALLALTNDRSADVRQEAWALITTIAEKSKDQGLRESLVERLLETARKDEGNQEGLRSHIMEWLLEFRPRDFTVNSRKALRGMLGEEAPPDGEILVCGVADMKDEIPRLRGYVRGAVFGAGVPKMDESEGGWWQTADWQAIRAMARMGAKEEIAKVIQLVSMEPKPDIRYLLTANLSYVTVPEVVAYLDSVLQSDEEVPGRGPEDIPGGMSVKVCMNQAAAAALAEMLQRFPIKPLGGGIGYNKQQIELCRRWMREQKEWRIIE